MIESKDYLYNAYLRIFIDKFDIKITDSFLEGIGYTSATFSRILGCKSYFDETNFDAFVKCCREKNLIKESKRKEIDSFKKDFLTVAGEMNLIASERKDVKISNSKKKRKALYDKIQMDEEIEFWEIESQDRAVELMRKDDYYMILKKQFNCSNIAKHKTIIKMIVAMDDFDISFLLKYIDMTDNCKAIVEEFIEYHIDEDTEVLSFSDNFTRGCDEWTESNEKILIEDLLTELLEAKYSELRVWLICYLSHCVEPDILILKRWHQMMAVMEKEYAKMKINYLEFIAELSRLPSMNNGCYSYETMVELRKIPHRESLSETLEDAMILDIMNQDYSFLENL